MLPPRCVNLAAALLLALPFTAAAQAVNLQNRVRAAPTGIAIPGVSIAGAEEPTAVQLNPAGTGFVDAFTLQYFHQGRSGTGLGEDGFWATVPLGGLLAGSPSPSGSRRTSTPRPIARSRTCGASTPAPPGGPSVSSPSAPPCAG